MDSERSWRQRRLHFIGVGGTGMSGLALACAELGAQVTGSDRAQPAALERLRSAGVRVTVGHRPENVPSGSEVVYSSAVRSENVERMRAVELGLSQLRRGELLAELSRLRRCIAIAGSHGKTTTSAMTAWVLGRLVPGCSYVIGAELRDGSPSASWQPGEWLVVESDESDRTFLALEPEIGVVTSITPEHLSQYGSLDALRAAFGEFLGRCSSVVVPDDAEIRLPADGRPLAGGRPPVTFAPDDVRVDPAGVSFRWHGHPVRLRVPGEHNARNAAAALEACRLAGADPMEAALAIATFPGARRRLELLGTTPGGARLYEDYAIHANTIRAGVAALRSIETGRLVVVFEPILYTRTQAMAAELGGALAEADAVVVLDVYPGSEAGRRPPGVSGRLVADAARERSPQPTVIWAPDTASAESSLASLLGPGDVCVFMGAGSAPQRLARTLLAAG